MSMTDREKKDLKAEVSSAFDNFNVLENAATIGNLKNDVLRLIDSVQNGHKFKVGDWIISEEAHKDYRICKITAVEDECYSIESVEGYKGFNNFKIFEAIYHIWNIKDAQPGDVVVHDHEYFLFKNMNTSNDFFAYCKYDAVFGYVNLEILADKKISYAIEDVVPATKDQRETLFRKLTEAGYKWNAEQRELINTGEGSDGNDLEKEIFRFWHEKGANIYEDTAHHFANWQKERDKKWLVVNHKQIFNNGYAEGFEAGRDDAYDEIAKKAVKCTASVDLNGFTCVDVPNVHPGKTVNIVILEDD